MTKYQFKGIDGDWYEAVVNKEDSALEHIQKRIENFMPIEAIDAEKFKEKISTLNIVCQRDLTAKEANALVSVIKKYVLQEIDKADKYYVSKSSKGKGGTKNNGKS